ncbi:MAG TPA: GNA1162 family protein [Opitutaceae bacterium]|nr:GNA1162 family protein [Opitutaceae bacterium]
MAENAGLSGLIEALVTQVMNKLTDQAHIVAAMASWQLVAPQRPAGQGLLKGPRHPEYGKD